MWNFPNKTCSIVGRKRSHILIQATVSYLWSDDPRLSRSTRLTLLFPILVRRWVDYEGRFNSQMLGQVLLGKSKESDPAIGLFVDAMSFFNNDISMRCERESGAFTLLWSILQHVIQMTYSPYHRWRWRWLAREEIYTVECSTDVVFFWHQILTFPD